MTRKRTRKISCLMVTMAVPERFRRFTRSVLNYCEQTYPNRELVIVPDPRFPGGIPRLESFLRKLGRSDIRLAPYSRRGRINLGRLRNFSVRQAEGELMCQWDDDDLHHPDRLLYQSRVLSNKRKGAVYLVDILHFLERQRKVYMANLSSSPCTCHPATGLYFKKDFPGFPERGRASMMAEDANLLSRLSRTQEVFGLRGCPYLYTYVNHGKNLSSLSEVIMGLRSAPISHKGLKKLQKTQHELSAIGIPQTWLEDRFEKGE